jgi:putative hydrolase of the HAD superfamily
LTSRPIKAVTFDFWNTLYSADDGAMDLVRPRREKALRQLLEAAGRPVSEEAAAAAYRSGFEQYLTAWSRGIHYGARDHVSHIVSLFKVSPPSQAVEETIAKIENLGLEAPLELLPGAKETIPALAEAGYQLGLISDTSLTPGRILVRFLEADDLAQYFGAFTYSDVTGFTKPDPRMFTRTLEPLGVEPASAAHLGDTPSTDIAGAKALGMLAIRCAGVADYTDPPEADFVIRDLRELPPLLPSGS